MDNEQLGKGNEGFFTMSTLVDITADYHNLKAKYKELKKKNKMLIEMVTQYHFVNNNLREEIKKLKSGT
jgi:predicted nuclease with TOPRIM domain